MNQYSSILVNHECLTKYVKPLSKKEKLTICLIIPNLNIHKLHHYMSFNHHGKILKLELIAILKIDCETLMRKTNYDN